MKITKSQLKRIIREEKRRLLEQRITIEEQESRARNLTPKIVEAIADIFMLDDWDVGEEAILNQMVEDMVVNWWINRESSLWQRGEHPDQQG